MTLVFGLWLFLLNALPDDAASFDSWLEQGPRIRVGLQKTAHTQRLESQSPLLVLDGNIPIAQIEPKGVFFIAPTKERARKASGWLIQLATMKTDTELATTRAKLALLYPDWNFVVRRNKQQLGLCIGPFANREAAEKQRKKLLEKDFEHLITVQAETEANFLSWVDADLDKHSLHAYHLGLVRLDPNESIRFGETSYRGVLRFRMENGAIRVINELPLETYLRGVVPSELGPYIFPELEAQKAQAVAARTYALRNLNRFRSRGYDICDSPACQAYDGTKNEHPLSDQAIAETSGEVLLLEGQLADALYTSTSGGATEDVGEIFENRSDIHLKGARHYLDFPKIRFPSKNRPFPEQPELQDLAIRALLLGYRELPKLEGAFSAADFNFFFDMQVGTFGQFKIPEDKPLDQLAFWTSLAKLPALSNPIRNQIGDEDAARYLEFEDLPLSLRPLGALLLRLDVLQPSDLTPFTPKKQVSRAAAYSLLFRLTERLRKKTDWSRASIKALEGNLALLKEPLLGRTTLDLSAYPYYITRFEDRWVFLEQPNLEAFDYLYLPDPKIAPVLRLETHGEVASLDRFSSLQSWFEVKDRETLERTARKAIPSLRGLSDIRVLRRAASGRVVDLEFIADSGHHRVTGFKVRVALGVKETLFDFFPTYDKDRLLSVAFLGRGWGHGVGMSQTGAFALAELGWDYRKILQHYYSGVTIATQALQAEAQEKSKDPQLEIKQESESAKLPEEEQMR